MGWDFAALIAYSGVTDQLLAAVDRLEANRHEVPLAAVIQYGDEHGPDVSSRHPVPVWRDLEFEPLPSGRPTLPTLQAILHLPSGFSLTFGRDAICLIHMLRWSAFLTDDGWQAPLLRGVTWFCDLFSASHCIITRDEHPSLISFREGASFCDALNVPPEEGEVEHIADMHLFLGEDSEWAIKAVDNALVARMMPWPADKPLSKGWIRPTIWDSKGFWRLRWQEVI